MVYPALGHGFVAGAQRRSNFAIFLSFKRFLRTIGKFLDHGVNDKMQVVRICDGKSKKCFPKFFSRTNLYILFEKLDIFNLGPAFWSTSPGPPRLSTPLRNAYT